MARCQSVVQRRIRSPAMCGFTFGPQLWLTRDEPVTGVGSRMFYDYSVTLRDASMRSYDADPLFAHNEYLQMLADYGWVGLALLIGVVLVHVAHGLRFVRWFASTNSSTRPR